QQRARFHVLDRRDRRHRAMAARSRKQRYVVARRLIRVRVAEVVDARLAQLAETRRAQIVVGADDLGARYPVRPPLGMIDDEQRRHWAAPFGSMTTRFAS